MESLLIECDACAVRGPACADCVVGVIRGFGERIEFDAVDHRAITNLVAVGLVPPSRMERHVGVAHG